MIVICLPEGHGLHLMNVDDIPQRQSMWMTGNLQLDLLCCLPIRRRTLVPLPSSVTTMRAREPMYEITVVGVLLVVLRGNRVRFEDLTDSEASIEWIWIGTMIECLGIRTCGTPPAYLRVPMLVTANGVYGIARAGQNRRGMIPTTTILNIDRVAPLLIHRDTVGTRITTTDPQGGRTKIVSGIKVDLGRIGTGDLSSVILPPPLVQQAPGRLGRSVKQGNSGNGMQEGGRRILLRPCLVQNVGMTRDHL